MTGTGLAPPQIGIDRAAIAVRTPDRALALLNPRVVEESTRTDKLYESCLSFFDVRGMVPRPLTIQVEHQDPDGGYYVATFGRRLARLVAHEIDHLRGTLYTDRMRPSSLPAPAIPAATAPSAIADGIRRVGVCGHGQQASPRYRAGCRVRRRSAPAPRRPRRSGRS